MPVERRVLRENSSACRLLYGAVGLAFLAAALWLALAWLLSDVVNRVFLAHQTLHDVARGTRRDARADACARGADVGQRRGRTAQRQSRQGRPARPSDRKAVRARPDLHARRADRRTRPRGGRRRRGARRVYQPVSAGATARRLVPALVFGVILVLDPWTLPILLFTGPILAHPARADRRAHQGTHRAPLYRNVVDERALLWTCCRACRRSRCSGAAESRRTTIETISRHYGTTTMDVLRTAFQTSLVLEWGATAATALVAIEVSVRLMNGHAPLRPRADCLAAHARVFSCRCGSSRSNIMPARRARRQQSASTQFSTSRGVHVSPRRLHNHEARTPALPIAPRPSVRRRPCFLRRRTASAR